MDACLEIRPSARKTCEELLQLPLFKDLVENDVKEKPVNLYQNVTVRRMDELYYLWQLAGGDMTIELKKQGLIRSRPPILSIPK